MRPLVFLTLLVFQACTAKQDETPKLQIAIGPGQKPLMSKEGAIRLWDILEGKQIVAVGERGEYPFGCAALRVDGEVLATGTYKAIQLWDVATGKQLQRIFRPDSVTTIVFHPDGKQLAFAEKAGHD